jgi:hypothetical protein
MSYILFFIADCKNSFPFDIVFINDESSSITPADFYASLQTMADIVNKFTIGEDNVRVALVAFNELARTVFNFNTSFVKSEINSTILGTTQSSGSTNDSDILNALNYTCSNILSNVNAGAFKYLGFELFQKRVMCTNLFIYAGFFATAIEKWKIYIFFLNATIRTDLKSNRNIVERAQYR